MTDIELYKKSLQKILQSSEFKNSPTYRKLLSYLFDFHLKGEIPKEITIAMELFKRDSSFNPSDDPIVRVYVHELRKRLKIYYQTEGKKEKIRLAIPKGGYELQFNNISPKSSKFKIVLNYALFLLLFFSIILNLKLFKEKISYQNNEHSKICASNIWSDILSNDKPILIVFGDVFFFKEKYRDTQSNRIVRDENINSIEDLELYKSKNTDPVLEISPSKRHTYLIEYSAYSLINLLPILNSAHKPISIRLCSKLTVEDLKTHNIVYIGFIKCLGSFKLYFQKSQFNITSNYSLSFFDKNTDSLIVYSSDRPTNYHMDYGFIIKFLGPNNNTILLLTGTRLPGTLGVVHKVANVRSIEKIEKKFINQYRVFPKNFEILYEVFGLNRQFIQSDMLFFQSTDNQIHDIWNP